jgi:hypothetical protein
MVFVSSTEKAMDVIKAGFDGSQDERNEGPLAEAIKAALATDSVCKKRRKDRLSSYRCRALSYTRYFPLQHQGIELGHVSILFDDEVFVPAYNSPVTFNSFSMPNFDHLLSIFLTSEIHN